MIFKNKYLKKSYSQCGEDLIVDFLLKNMLKLKNITYLDLGTNHPIELNNTYLFYEQGFTGVCVEPNPELVKDIKKIRKRDKCLNCGINFTNLEKVEEKDFYIMTANTLSTFSKESAYEVEKYGSFKIEKTIKVQLSPINIVIEENFDTYPNFVSLDIEGLELEVLKTLDFSKYRPEVFCIETLTYSEDGSNVKQKEIIDFMLEKNYYVYADTYLNTIFVDKNKKMK